MGRTLLVGSADTSWRDWLKAERRGRDLIVIDPADTTFGHAGRLVALRGDRPVMARFYGSLDAARAPHMIIAALVEMLRLTDENAIILCFPINGSPLLRQLLLLVAQFVRPDRILVAEKTPIDQAGFPVGPEEISVETTFSLVQHAQRKAQWIRMIEKCLDHTVLLSDVTLEGARLGSGKVIDPKTLGIQALRCEVAASTLFAVVDEEPNDEGVSRALDASGCSRATFASPDRYRGLFCALVRENGEDLGCGFITDIDWKRGVIRAKCTAIPPAPARILRLGSLRLDSGGNELGEVRPWSV
ncbi:MAG: hypothetical protein ACOYON_07795 [Fimbriimonas sp.]